MNLRHITMKRSPLGKWKQNIYYVAFFYIYLLLQFIVFLLKDMSDSFINRYLLLYEYRCISWIGVRIKMCTLKGYIDIKFLFVFGLKHLNYMYVCYLLISEKFCVEKAFEFIKLWISWNENYQVHSGQCLILLLVFYSLLVLSQRKRKSCSLLF